MPAVAEAGRHCSGQVKVMSSKLVAAALSYGHRERMTLEAEKQTAEETKIREVQ